MNIFRAIKENVRLRIAAVVRRFGDNYCSKYCNKKRVVKGELMEQVKIDGSIYYAVEIRRERMSRRVVITYEEIDFFKERNTVNFGE
jgi:hypothetical protein